MGNFGF